MESAPVSPLARAAMRLLGAALLAALAYRGARDCARPAHGDEVFYMAQARAVAEDGLVTAAARGNPLGFTVPLALLHALGLPLLGAGRLLSVLSFAVALAGVWRFTRCLQGTAAPWRGLAMLTALQVAVASDMAFSCISDPLFSATAIWALALACEVAQDWGSRSKPVVAGLLAGAALWVRPLALFLLPGAALGLLLAARRGPSGGRRRALGLLGGTFVAMALAIQVPALARGHGVRFENKDPENGLTWPQLQYLSQLRYDDGTLPEGQHVAWAEVAKYLDRHGPDALPRTLGQSVTRDWRLTLREFGKDLVFGSGYALVRRTGLLWLAALAAVWLFRGRGVAANCGLVAGGAALGHVLVVSFVVITNIEWRWLLVAVLVCLPLGARALEALAARPRGRRAARVALAAQLLFLAVSLALDLGRVMGLR